MSWRIHLHRASLDRGCQAKSPFGWPRGRRDPSQYLASVWISVYDAMQTLLSRQPNTLYVVTQTKPIISTTYGNGHKRNSRPSNPHQLFNVWICCSWPWIIRNRNFAHVWSPLWAQQLPYLSGPSAIIYLAPIVERWLSNRPPSNSSSDYKWPPPQRSQ